MLMIRKEQCSIFSKNIFLKQQKKKQLIEMLPLYLKNGRNKFINRPRNAYPKICETALKFTTSGEKEVIFMMHDTDILVMLVNYWKSEMKNIIFLHHKVKRNQKIGSVTLCQIKDHILFVYPINAYDTKSAPCLQ